MPLDLNMMSASVRIIGDVPDRTLIGHHRGPIGTGFLMAVPSETDPATSFGYVVTAHHVLDGQSRVQVQAPNPLIVSGDSLLDPEPVTDWRQPLPRVDLAVASFGCTVDDGHGTPVTGALHFGQHVTPANAVPPLGGIVHYIGLFEPYNRTMARSGTFGALFQNGIRHDGDYEYPCHLFDCRSYKGFSGSPCYSTHSFAKLDPIDREAFPYPVPPAMEKELPLSAILDLTLLCGMFTEYVENVDIEPGDPISKYGVGIMLPSLFIWMALYTKELRDERLEKEAMDEEASSQTGPQTKKASIPTGERIGEDEFERFEELARQLANTPKPPEDKTAQ
jgi:hypothetical protein